MESWCLELLPGRKVTVIPTLNSSTCLLLSVCATSTANSSSLLVSFDDFPPVCVARLNPTASQQPLNVPFARKCELVACGAPLFLFGSKTAGVSFIREQEPSTGILKNPLRDRKPHSRSVSFNATVQRSLGDGLIYETVTRGRPSAIVCVPGQARWRFRFGPDGTEVVARLGFQSELCQGLDLTLRGMRCGEVRKIRVPEKLDSCKTPAGEYLVEFLGPAGPAKSATARL